MFGGSRPAADRALRPQHRGRESSYASKPQLMSCVDLERFCGLGDSDSHAKGYGYPLSRREARCKLVACLLAFLLAALFIANGILISRHMELVAQSERLAQGLITVRHEITSCKHFADSTQVDLSACHESRVTLRSQLDDAQAAASQQNKTDSTELIGCQQQVAQCQQASQQAATQQKAAADQLLPCQQASQQRADQLKGKGSEVEQCQQQNQALSNKMQGIKSMVN